jgi:hypothetical protein
MWVALRDWMVADNEPPRPSVGSVLRSIGIRVTGTLAVTQPGAADAIEAVATTIDPLPGLVEYLVTGTADQARDIDIDVDGRRRHSGAEFVLAVNAHRFQARVDGWAHEVRPGSRVAVRGQLSVVGDYEWDAFQLSDSRADWHVAEVVVLETGDAMIHLDHE